MAVGAKMINMGRTLGPYGVRGWVRIAPEGDGEVLAGSRLWWFLGEQDAQPRRLEVEAVRSHGRQLVAKWKGCESPEEARLWKGRILMDRGDFPPAPEGKWWAVDLVGCRVENPRGEFLGEVDDIATNGVQDLLSVTRDGRTVLIPMVPAYLVSVDVAGRLIVADWSAEWL